MDILFSKVGDFTLIEYKDNLTLKTVWNTGETGDIKYPLGAWFYFFSNGFPLEEINSNQFKG